MVKKKSQNGLGWMYMKGIGVKQNYTEVIKWFEKAVQQGLASSMVNLGALYNNGLGTAKDLIRHFNCIKKQQKKDYLLHSPF